MERTHDCIQKDSPSCATRGTFLVDNCVLPVSLTAEDFHETARVAGPVTSNILTSVMYFVFCYAKGSRAMTSLNKEQLLSNGSEQRL
jgi:hypothetical protein